MPFEKGQVLTHKRTGRPKGFKGMAREIQKRTKNGKALVDFAMEIFEDAEDKYFLHQRQWACQFLADRGFGRPMQTVELDAAISTPPPGPKLHSVGLSAVARRCRPRARDIAQLARGGDVSTYARVRARRVRVRVACATHRSRVLWRAERRVAPVTVSRRAA